MGLLKTNPVTCLNRGQQLRAKLIKRFFHLLSGFQHFTTGGFAHLTSDIHQMRFFRYHLDNRFFICNIRLLWFCGLFGLFNGP